MIQMSSKKEKAILIPASFKDEEKRYGSLMKHAMHLGKYGGVFWHVNVPGEKTATIFQHTEIEQAYFYSTSVKKVIYVCQIKKIGSIGNFEPYSEYERFVPEWRKNDWKSSIRISHGFWFLITDIKELLKSREISEFKKFENSEKLKHGAYPYAIIVDPKFEAI